MSTAISVDVVVDSQSMLGRYSIDTRSPVDRESTDYRSSVDRVSIECQSTVDRLSTATSIDCPSIGGRYSGRRTSTEYWSYVSGISANCRWYVGQLSVAYRSTVGGILVNCRSHISCVFIWSETKSSTNYGHGNLFFFQFVSSLIVWYLAVTQDQSGPKLNLWLAYLKLFPRDAMYQSSIGGVSAKCGSSIGQVSAKCRPSIGEVSARYRWPEKLDRPTCMSVECRLTLDRYSIDTRSIVDRLSIDRRPSVNRLLTATSTDIAVDIEVDITYSKHDP